MCALSGWRAAAGSGPLFIIKAFERGADGVNRERLPHRRLPLQHR